MRRITKHAAVAAAMALAAALGTPPAQAQNTHYGETFTLDSPLPSSQTHEYTASHHIDLLPGFHSEPGKNKWTSLQNDPSGIFPPDSCITGGPHPSDTGVVGAIAGTVDAGLMGAAVYSIPLELPEGINGMHPNLSVTYNSQSGNGLLGWGWDLQGLSWIERTGRTRYHDGTIGTVTLNDTTDRLALDGNRLIALMDYGDSVEYKTERDGMSRIRAYYAWLPTGQKGSSTSIRTISSFKVWRDDGKTLEYGGTDDSRMTLQDSGPKAFRWMLGRMTDRYGNSVVYHYSIHPNSGECYITSIEYTEHTYNGVVTIPPEFTVGFHYRPGNSKDGDVVYVAGNIVQDRKLLESVSISRNDPDTELARYRFRYRECVPSRYYDSVRMHERLKSILLERDGMTLNPTTLVWSDTLVNFFQDNIFMTTEDTAIYKNYPFIGDYNGDGLSDLAVVPHMDSVYKHNVDIRFFMNSPDNPGHFTLDPTLTMHNVDKRLDWLYPVDLNDDGLDDLVACFYDSIASEGRDTMFVKIFENMEGLRFECRDSVSLGGGRFLVHAGDFLGNGEKQLLLVPIPTNDNEWNVTIPWLVYHNTSGMHRVYSSSIFMNVRFVVTGDFDGNGGDDVLFVGINGSTARSVGLSSGFCSFSDLFATGEVNHANGRWNHVFGGDFNGDGMTDLLYNDKDNNVSRWRVFLSTGVSFEASERVSSLNYELPPFNYYSNSLRKVMDAFTGTKAKGYWNHSVCVGDFDGDGLCDVLGMTMNPTLTSANFFLRFNKNTREFQSHYHSTNGINAGSHYINCRSQYVHVGYFTGKENLSLLSLEYRNNSHTNNHPGVYSLKPSSELNSVSTVIDGMGNSVDLGYGYVRQPYRELGYGVRCLPVTVRVLKSVTTYNVSGYPMRERLGYADPCHHRDGHGWLGFGKRTRRLLENGEVVSSAVSHQSLETMSSHAMLLPVADTAFVFPNGTAVLSEATAYTFAKYLSSFGNLNPSRLVACPALEGKTTVRYDPESPGTILSKTITESHYNHTDGYYYHTYRCDSTLTGVGDATAESAADCEFRSSEATVYYYDDHASWTLNRPHSKVWVWSRTGKPDVERCRWYEYVSTTSLLPSCVYDIPNRVPDQNPLMIQTNFDYHQDGNLSSKTVIAPHGQFGEQRRAIAYEYGPGNRHRLVTNETTITGDLSYTTSYSYDDHDRIDTLTPPNGLETAYQSDAFGATSWTSGADGTRSCVARRWADGHPLAPAGATYYTWSRSSDGVQTLSFLHKTGVELRSVAFDIHGEPVITDKRYDGRGRLMAVSEPYKAGETVRWTLYGYDALDRPTSVTTPDTTCVATSYEGLRTETAVTSPSGQTRVTAVTVNAMGWTVRCDDAVGSHVVYDHYADGLMASATVNDDPATTVSATYDAARNRSSLIDPDYGTLATVYDAYGRLVRSTSPREQAAQAATTLSYDGMDRLVSVADGMEGTLTTYSYNETDTLKGTLAGIRLQRQGGADIQRLTYGYDTLARPVSVTEQRAGGYYTTVMSYDNLSRVDRVVHSTGVAVRYGYLRGQLWTVSDDNGRTLWKTKGTDAFGNVVEAELGNGASTQYAFDTVTHRLRGIVTTKNLQNLAYGYDKFGNLAARKDNTTRMEETFTYDNMNRLTGIDLTRSAGQGMHCTVAYDALGRMTSRQAVTSTGGVPQVETVFSNPSFDPVKVHAMTQAQTSAPAFPSASLDIAYTSFDKVSRIRQGGDSLRYSYGFDRQRMRMEEFSTGWSRTKDYVGRCEFVTENGASGTDSRSLTFVTGPCGVFAVVEDDGQTQSVHYVLKDNLGSWSVVTDGDGNVEQRLGYDAWGNPRDPSTWVNHPASGGFGKPMFDRGFTGHEHLPLFGLVNMNGRVYDPATASFLSPDRYMQDPTSAQGFNRYAYCMNNPLRFIDPTGYYVTYGGGHKPDGPLQQVVMDGHVGFVLPEVTVTAYENPINHFEFTYEPNNSGGGSGGYLSYGLNSNNPTIGSSGGGGGGNGAGHSGVVTTPTDPITVPPPIGNNGILLQNFWDGAITTNTYLNGVTTIFGKGAEWGQLVSEGVKETEAALMLGKVANGAKFFGAAGLLLNWGCLGIQVGLNQIPLQEGVVRGVMSGIELGLTFVPYVGPILSIGLTAFDIGGGFDNNLYKTDNWWKGNKP